MKTYLLPISLFIFTTLFAQFENPNNSVRFDTNETTANSPTGFEMPAIKKPSLTNNNNPYSPNNSTLGQNEEAPIDITKGDGLLDYKSGKAPKYFTKDKETKPEYGEDQYLGDFKTKSGRVTVMYRDHEFVDGDRIRVFLNGDVIEPNAYLDASFKGLTIPLQAGFNKFDFEALNQGSSGPNTAQLQVLDEEGNILSSQEWNLLTGRKATIIVVKE